ncbi:MAG: hypothetical protein LBU99_07145 [Spirochaetaceae bacterium]|jgi:hypothetical protein|nr:hypothetical protein [Spirochaetaceae bacterium]
MKGRIIIAILVTVLGLAAIIWLSGAALGLVDVVSFIIVPALPFLYMAGIHGFGGIGKAYRAAAGENRSEMKKAQSFFRDLERSFWLFSITTAFIGFIGIMMNFRPDPQFLANNLAVLVVALFYAGLFDLILIQPFLSVLNSKLAESSEA